MKTQQFFCALALFPSIAMITSCVGDPENASGATSAQTRSPADARPAKFSFVANQIAASVWVQPTINGHLDESYGVAGRWPTLIQNLKRAGGAFSIFAAETGYLHTDAGFLKLINDEGIQLSVELPGMTQCKIAHLIAEA